MLVKKHTIPAFTPSKLRQKIDRIPFFCFLCLCVLIASIIALYFFCPRFVLWQGLYVIPSHFNPEVNRAYYSLQLMSHPYMDIPNNVCNTTIRWRLFFPLLGYYLHMSDRVFLSIPFIGVFLTLFSVAHIALKETQDRFQTFLITLLSATTSWFVVSTGWLSYWDAWFVLSLVAVSFFPSRRALIYPCIFAPWIDERFLVGLALALLVRGYYLYDRQPDAVRKWKSDFIVVCLALIPWIILRGTIVLGEIDNSDTFVRFAEHVNVPHLAASTLWGFWHGLRVMWFYPFLLAYLIYKYYARIVAVGLLVLVVVTHVLGVYISGDVTRNAGEFFPLALLGIIYGFRWCKSLTVSTLPIVLALNLALPFTHIMTGFNVPIYYFPYEWNHLKTPPDEVNPYFYNSEAVELIRQNHLDDAQQLIDCAIQLKPDYGRAYFNSGYLKGLRGKFEEAIGDLTLAIRYDPQFPDAYYFRGVSYSQLKNPASAASDFSYALQIAPPDWGLRADATKRLQQCQQH